MTASEMEAGQSEFAAWQEAEERAEIQRALATPPLDRDRHQWAVLGYAYGPPVYAADEEGE